MPKHPPRDQARIYLDCDGVLADFETGARAVLGMSTHAFERQYGAQRFWSRLAGQPDFFGALPLMPDAMTLYAAVRHRNPVILTGVPHGSWSQPQKRRWVAHHFPGVEIITTSAALKREHCHPGDVLIDDRDRYRDRWEAEGGVFIHHTGAAASIAALTAAGLLP